VLGLGSEAAEVALNEFNDKQVSSDIRPLNDFELRFAATIKLK
jgi:hypothetical protein